ncbi:MAG: tRNA lysidine(34) synthetase TilS [Clostridiales bacterium]|nr:tRNA lysidine(34) synthetase TilS [Clostridiales bacterium]
MLEKIKDFSDRYDMLKKGNRVVAGVSGGADSVCLLLVLRELSLEKGFFLAAVHVDHGIRGEESRQDAVFTEQLCRGLEIPFALYTVDVPEYSRRSGQTMEEAARELRYRSFGKACCRFRADKVAVAHHAEDSAETMLFHLARGTGIRGLGGIAPVSMRYLQDGQESCYQIIRPLLCVTREEIESWLTERGQDWRTDRTNADVTYSRNRIRRLILPEMEAMNDRAVIHMQKTGEYLREVSDFLDEETRQAGKGVWEESGSSGGFGEIRIFCEPLKEMRPLLRKHLVLQLLGRAAGSRKDISAIHVEQVLNLMQQGVGRRICLPYGLTVRRTYDSVLLYRESGSEEPGTDSLTEPCDLRIPGDTVLSDGHYIRAKLIFISDFSQKIPKKTYTKWFDYNKIKSTVRLRTRQAGDYLQINAAGGHKSLKRYFVEEKIPADRRDGLFLLADGSHVIWVIGYRISEAYRVDGQTKRVLQVEVLDGSRDHMQKVQEGTGYGKRKD